MNRAIFSTDRIMRLTLRVLLFLLLSATTASLAAARRQNGAAPPPPGGEEKAEQILRRATEAVGGHTYLDMRSIIARGYFTQFKDGIAGLPSAFTDYLVFPDRERSEFRAQGVKVIQTNVGDTGWVYDGMTKTLKDIKPAQAADFRLALRASVDNILRGWWRNEKAQLSYVGRREAGLAKRNEVVRLKYPDGFTIEYEFGAKDNLPSKVLYKKQGAEGEETAEEDRLAQYLTINGVTMPFVIDHFRAGIQTSRINYDTVEFNRPVPDSLFARPADAKAVK